MNMLLAAKPSVTVNWLAEKPKVVTELYLQCLFPGIELQLGVAGSLHRKLDQGRKECFHLRSMCLQQSQESLKGYFCCELIL